MNIRKTLRRKHIFRKLVVIAFIIAVVVSQCLSMTAVSFTALDNYTLTDELTSDHKADSYQQNYQTLDVSGYDFTTLLAQSAEWIGKDDGTAEVNIYYSAEFEDYETRSVYIFTTCTGHSFTEDIAIKNILALLEYNEYVDVIMIGANNRASDVIYPGTGYILITADAAGAMRFSVRAEDDLTYENIQEILETYTNAELIANTNVHVLGCDDDEEEDKCSDTTETGYEYYDGVNEAYGPYIELLYSYIDFEEDDGTQHTDNDGVLIDGWDEITGEHFDFLVEHEYGYKTAIEFVLTFGNQRHAGELFSLYYLMQYYDIITGSGRTFEINVQAIFNSFDAMATALRNTDNAFPTNTLYPELLDLIGLDLGNDDFRFADIEENNTDVWNIIQTLKDYNDDGRYIALVPNDGVNTYDFVWYDGSIDEDIVNTLVYTLYMTAPIDDIIDNEQDIRAGIKQWVEDEQVITLETFREYNQYVYSYSTDMATIGALEDIFVDSILSISTTIVSDFTVKTSDIAVSVMGEAIFSSSLPIVTTNNDGSTTITVSFAGVQDYDDWVIRIQIPITLNGDIVNYCTDNDWFKNTNEEGENATTATLSTTVGRASVTEVVSVDSPKLYRTYTGDLEINKIVTGDYAEEDKDFSFIISINVPDGEYGDVTIHNSVGYFTLAHNETISITDLPIGVAYTIYEVATDGYTSGSVNASGTTEANRTINVTFINTRGTGGISITKHVEGEDDEEAVFTFVIELDVDVNGEYGGVTFENGQATVTLMANESIGIDGLPAGATYTITEVEQDGYNILTNGSEGNGYTGMVVTDTTISTLFINQVIEEVVVEEQLIIEEEDDDDEIIIEEEDEEEDNGGDTPIITKEITPEPEEIVDNVALEEEDVTVHVPDTYAITAAKKTYALIYPLLFIAFIDIFAIFIVIQKKYFDK